MISYLFKDFLKLLKEYYTADVKISIQKDNEFRLNLIKKSGWILIKNNIKSSINAKLRFLIQSADYDILSREIGSDRLLSYFKTIVIRLKKITGINEIEFFSSGRITDPASLGHPEKYFVINLSISIASKSFLLLFVIRDEMLLFPFVRISSNFILKTPDKLFKKAFIEVDKHIIWNGMNNWGSELKKRLITYVKDYPAYKYRLYPSNDAYAYRLFVRYIHILYLLYKEKKIGF